MRNSNSSDGHEILLARLGHPFRSHDPWPRPKFFHFSDCDMNQSQRMILKLHFVFLSFLNLYNDV